MDNLYKLSIKDVESSADSLAKAFYDYEMFQYILADKLSNENLRIFFKFLIKNSILYAEAYASSRQMEGIILFSDSNNNNNFSALRLIKSGIIPLLKIGLGGVKRLYELDKFISDTHKRIMKDDHVYITSLGVNPSNQGQGYSRKLMQLALKRAEEKGQATYLETFDRKNVDIYNKFGFKLVSEDVFPDTNIIQYAMLKEK